MRTRYFQVQPFLIDFGIVYRHARLGGSFQVLDVSRLTRVVYDWESSRQVYDSAEPPAWAKVVGPQPTPHDGLWFGIDIDTARVGFKWLRVRMEAGKRQGTFEVRALVRNGEPPRGDLVICNEPCDSNTLYPHTTSLIRVVGELGMRVHHLSELPEHWSTLPATLLLHQYGLMRAGRDRAKQIRGLAEAGTNVVVLADDFYRGTVDAANAIVQPYGMEYRPIRFRPARSMAALIARDAHRSGPEEIARHPLCRGVRNLWWHRPTPIRCDGRSARPLVAIAGRPTDAFVAWAKPKGYVVAVGSSLYSHFSGVGWPFDNDRLLANLLAGGDGEAPPRRHSRR